MSQMASPATAFPNEQIGRRRWEEWGQRVGPGALLGSLTKCRHLPHFRTLDMLLGAGILPSAEHTDAISFSTEVQWTLETGSSETMQTKGCL